MPKQLFKLATIFTFLILSTSLQAQIDSAKADKGVNINFFNGYAISYKWNTTQNLNYRVYLGLNSSWTDREEEIVRTTIPDVKHIRTDDNRFINSELSLQFLYNIVSKKPLKIYLGLGPLISYNHNFREYTSTKNDDITYHSTTTDYSFGMGVVVLSGIEAFLTNTITLFAETHISGLRTWSNEENPATKTITNGSNWSANIQLVKVGLGIYF